MDHSHQPNRISWLPLFLIGAGCLLMALWGVHQYFYNQAISLSNTILVQYAKEPATRRPYPIHITIGNSINLPIVEAGEINGTWAVSQTSANHVRESAVPGQAGNIIIYAHNTPNLFGKLENVRVGDRIDIRATDGSLHSYKVASTEWVTTGHTELLTPTKTETLTLYTCAGLLDSLRNVVQAIPVK